jgi:hypothetical protein
MAVGFKDFLNVDYTQTGDGQLAKNAKKRKMDTTGGNNAEYSSTHGPSKTDEALSMAQRRARARQMKKYATRLKMGRKRAMAKMADAPRLKKRAQKAARAALAKKLTKGIPKGELTPARKMEIEKRLDKMKQRVNRLAKKMLPTIRKKELARRQG